MDFRDRSILTQVAFKAAVEAGDDVLTDDGVVAFEHRFTAYANSLFNAVRTQQNAGVNEQSNAQQQTRGVDFAAIAAERAKQEFGATPIPNYETAAPVEGFTSQDSVTVVDWKGNPTGGSAPKWATDKAIELGSTKIVEQVAWAKEGGTKADGTLKRPPFKTYSPTKGQGEAIWQPKGVTV